MTRILRLTVLLLSAAVLSGCAMSSVEGYLDIAKERGGISKEYLMALNKWSRDRIIYSEFETKFRIAATYKSRPFSEAYVREYSRIYLLTKPEEVKRMKAMEELSADFTEFFFYAYIPERDSNDFAKVNSIWTVFLLDEKGTRHYPLEIRRMEKITPVIEEFYPYGNPYWGNYYLMKFSPLVREGKMPSNMKLVFASVLGRIEMEWKD
jgi:hypothetical protein